MNGGHQRSDLIAAVSGDVAHRAFRWHGMSKVRPRRHDRAATGRTGPASRLRTRSHPTAPHARARRTSRRPRWIANRTAAARGSCCSTTATSLSPKSATPPCLIEFGPPPDRCHRGHRPGTEPTLSTTRHHRNDVGAARGVAARQGHRRDRADHQRPRARTALNNQCVGPGLLVGRLGRCCGAGTG